MHGGRKWVLLQTPVLEFCNILKETSTHGVLYVISDKTLSLAFISQSVPVITRVIYDKTQFVLNNSSIYRMIRVETKKKTIKNHWKAKKFKRGELLEFNNHLRKYDQLLFITKNPDLYSFIQEPDECQNSERTCPSDHAPSD